MAKKRTRKKNVTLCSRTRQVALKFTEGEFIDLRVIADDWDVPVARVAWFILAQSLANIRGRKIQNAPYQKSTAAIIEELEARMGTDKELIYGPR